mmetsp:Transcript_24192/g.21277  ORF Transcript_24192/g.21277 Transcript_24192/m.21277 type:complete len:295 (+) Transcript_24192:1332-2216(+)
MVGYKYYDGTAARDQIIYTDDGGAVSPTFIDEPATNMLAYTDFPYFKLITREIDAARVPIRIRFKSAAAVRSVKVKLPANEYDFPTSNGGAVQTLSCTVREIVVEDVPYGRFIDTTPNRCEKMAVAITLGWELELDVGSSLSTGTLYELIFSTTDTTDPHFDQLSSDSETAQVTFYSDDVTTAIATKVLPLYQYQATPLVSLDSVMFFTKKQNDKNTIVFTLDTNAVLTDSGLSNFEIEFTSASSTAIKNGFTGRNLPCVLDGTAVQELAISNDYPRCTLVETTPPRVRVENLR